MASFDFIDSAMKGYRFFWQKRLLIAHLAGVPFLVKLVCYGSIVFLGLSEDILRQGLLLLPSYFAEGWLVAHVIRLVAFGESFPSSLSGDRRQDMELLLQRGRALSASMIVYVLIKLVLAFVTGIVLINTDAQALLEPSEPDANIFFAGVFLMAVLFWGFRLLWLYIPVALDYGMKDFLVRFRSFKISFYMIALWLVCFVPLAMGFLLFTEVLANSLAGDGGIADVRRFFIVFLQVGFELVISIIASLAMTYGIISLYEKSSK